MNDASPRNTTNSRLAGLDTLRALAILLVLMYHYEVVVSHRPTFGFLTEIGWAGVDLFFVLSGYLIGNQIFSALARGEGFSLKVFFARRLLRTLPNYYFILATYFIFPSVLGGTSTASIWRFLSFTQNIGLHYGETFSHSWSLCIEEQFYLILPVAALLIASFSKSKRIGWSVLLAGVIAGMLVRAWAWMNFGHNAINALDFSEHIYYSSFARFDELLPGVAIAMLKNFHGKLYAKILSKGNLLLIVGAIAMAAAAYLFLNYYQIEGYGFTFGMTTFGYTLLPISFALLTLSALSPNSWLNRIRIPGTEKLALWSYAIYLAHKPIFKLAIEPLTRANIDVNAPAGIAIIMVAGMVGGWVLYRLVERPFMVLRDRYFPVSRGQAQESQLIMRNVGPKAENG